MREAEAVKTWELRLTGAGISLLGVIGGPDLGVL